jgi:hypothetical protein
MASSIVLTDPDEAEQAVADLATSGVDCIQVYSNLKATVLEAVVAAANNHKLPVVGHVPTGIALEESGMDDVQHLIGLPRKTSTSGVGNPMVDGWHPLSSERIVEIAEYSKSNGVTHSPWWSQN